MYRKQVRRRRAVLALLVAVSVVLLTSTFAGSAGGPFGTIRDGVATVLGPVEDGASRALKPAQDLVNWFRETFNARGENADLRAEVAQLRKEVTDKELAISENRQFRGLLKLDKSGPLAPYKPVTGRVIGRSPTVWYSSVTIDVGSADGVRINDPVVTGDGVAGKVTATTGSTSEVTLITDHTSAVSARVLSHGAEGVVEPEAGDPNSLLLDFINSNETIHPGDLVVTAGWASGKIASAYPYGLRIGRVTKAAKNGQQTYQRVNLLAFADLRDMEYVQVLTDGPRRAGVGR